MICLLASSCRRLFLILLGSFTSPQGQPLGDFRHSRTQFPRVDLSCASHCQICLVANRHTTSGHLVSYQTSTTSVFLLHAIETLICPPAGPTSRLKASLDQPGHWTGRLLRQTLVEVAGSHDWHKIRCIGTNMLDFKPPPLPRFCSDVLDVP